MPYPTLDPAISPDRRFEGLCALAIMAKAPRPGKVKTRLSPPLTPLQAAQINVCFLQDTATNLGEIASSTGRATGVISYTPIGDEALFDGLLPQGFQLLPQRGNGFGERLLATAQDLLKKGFTSLCLIDSDSPTVPAQAYRQAVEELQRPGDRMVLGPSFDGGYYLIGMKSAHPEPFENISWSSSTVADETRTRCRDASIELTELPLWYDVDDAETLRILSRELLDKIPPTFVRASGYIAENTKSFLAHLQSELSPFALVEEPLK